MRQDWNGLKLADEDEDEVCVLRKLYLGTSGPMDFPGFSGLTAISIAFSSDTNVECLWLMYL